MTHTDNGKLKDASLIRIQASITNKQTFHISHVCISLKMQGVLAILGDFKICIGVPLKVTI